MSQRNRAIGQASFKALAGTLLISGVVTFAPDPAHSANDTNSISGNFLAGHVAQKRRDLPTALKFLNRTLEQDSEQLDVLRRAFLFNVMEGRIDEALALAERYSKTDPKEPITALALAIRDAKNEDWQNIIDRMSAMDSTGLNGFTAPALQGWAVFAKDGLKAGLDALKPLRDIGGTRTLHDLHAGLMHEISSDEAAAVTYYLSVAEDDGGSSLRSTRILGTLYERQDKKSEAKATYDLYLQAQPGSQFINLDMERLETGDTKVPVLIKNAQEGIAEALFGIASSLNQQGGSETALVLARLALYLRPEFPVMRYMAAGILEQLYRYEDAIAVYKKLPDNTPFSRSAKIRIARNLDSIDKTDEAIDILKAAGEMYAKDPRPVTALGDLYRGRERWDDAISAYDDAIERLGTPEPRHWQMLYSRGVVAERAGQWERAEKDLLKALEFEPDQPLVLNYLGYSWVEKRQNLERALEMIKTAVSKRPHDGYITDSLGWVYYQFGRYEEAVPELERAVELRPEDPVINDHLGDAYWRVGRTREAAFQWNHSQALDPEPELKEQLEKKLKHGLVEEASAVIKTTPNGG